MDKKFKTPKITINKVYTKKGDDGYTSLIGGEKVKKNSARICGFGEIDELNVLLGLCATNTEIDKLKIKSKIVKIQNDLFNLGIVDEIIKEPLGGAHRDKDKLLKEIKKSIGKNLNELSEFNREDILNHRKQKFLSIGRKKGFIKDTHDGDKMTIKKNILLNLKQKINKNKLFMPIAIILIALIFLALIYL